MKNSSYLPAHQDGAEYTETSAYKIQTPGNYPEEGIQQAIMNTNKEMQLYRLIYYS
jgi:hypothetical protein